ncbi:MAG TPA: type VI secretion system-associated FHA domain protein TagH [Acetobacteraceae bacterium]|nr:type VI secretion system-associated FHA domain protein TagH [Acetobacteraceae bacterium]
MQLTMTVLRCPDAVAPETRSVAGGEFSVGRGPGVDWVLPDPERLLSKRHFAVAFRGGAWQLADTSTNGTFLNRGSDPIGAGEVRSLHDGDRLRLGAYEIEVRLVEEAARPRTGAGSSPFADPFAMDPFGPARPEHNPFDEPDHPSLRIPPTSAQLPHDFDPLAPEPHETPFRGPTQADNSPVTDDAFHLPAEVGQMPLHSGGAIPGDDLLPDDWDKDLLEGIAPTGSAPAAPEPPPRPVARAAPPRRIQSEAPSPIAPPPVAAPRPTRSPSSEPEPVADDGALLAAFLEGAGLPDVRPQDPPATMLALGKAFRDLVAGLRAVLIARAQIKGEFRIEQTMIQARGNNPLKFSAGDDDALAALLGTGRHTDMAPHEAVADALRDIRLHELASMAAMQAAVRAVLERLDPAKLRAQAEQGGGMALLPVQKKARAWDAYEALHAHTVQALADDFDSVFGKAFARAYERSLHEVSARERE